MLPTFRRIILEVIICHVYDDQPSSWTKVIVEDGGDSLQGNCQTSFSPTVVLIYAGLSLCAGDTCYRLSKLLFILVLRVLRVSERIHNMHDPPFVIITLHCMPSIYVHHAWDACVTWCTNPCTPGLSSSHRQWLGCFWLGWAPVQRRWWLVPGDSSLGRRPAGASALKTVGWGNTLAFWGYFQQSSGESSGRQWGLWTGRYSVAGRGASWLGKSP